MTNTILAAALVTLGMSLPASADPTIGLGLSISFGSGKVETGLGLRVFSDNQPDKVVGSVGVDYMFQSKRIRPTIGVAYLGDNSYIGLDLGFGLNGEGLDFGLGLGAVKTKRLAAPVIAPAAAPAPAVVPVVPVVTAPSGPSDIV